MQVEGVIQNGQIRLPDNVVLPENATVYVIIPDAQTPKPSVVSNGPTHLRSPRLADPAQAVGFRKQIMELPSDAKL